MTRTFSMPDPRDTTQELTIDVDMGDYPKLLINAIFKEDEEEVHATPALLDEIYQYLGPLVAGNLCDDAMDLLDDLTFHNE